MHLVPDNYATHKTPAVQRWLARHPQYHLHFTPTSASWLSQVERVFADLTAKQLKRGVFRSVRYRGLQRNGFDICMALIACNLKRSVSLASDG